MNPEIFNPIVEAIKQDLKNEMIIYKVNYLINSITILTINNYVRDKDLKLLRAFIQEHNLMMMISYNMLYHEQISIILLKKQSYAIHPIN